MKKYFKNQAGQSLLEMIFAIGILLMVMAAVLALSSSNIAGEKESESQIVANNLAREGIEVVRNIRDSNWLNKDDWDTGLTTTATNGRPIFKADNNTWTINFPPSQTNPSFLVYLSNAGIFNYDQTGAATGYYRYLLIRNICQKSTGEEYAKTDQYDCPPAEIKIGLKVESVVDWQDSGKARQVSIEDYLYAWK